jgi:hypothetical protein
MWFLFVEIFLLIAVSFLVGSGATVLALRMVLPATDNKPSVDGATSEVGA